MTKAYSYLRFSTPEQSKGDSFRRQTELSRDYARRHALDLDEHLTFKDLGVSAFRGKNAQEGALGAFLKAIATGKIRKGSYLLVENLDRLSRDKVRSAFVQFTGILECGVNVVTLTDGKLYTADKMDSNFGDLMFSLTTMFRAHDESSVKSKRLGAAWKAKRETAQTDGKKLTARCPAWLTLSGDRKSFTVDSARKKIIRRIFDMTIAGHGKSVIARRFNAEGVGTFGRSKGWHDSYVQKILENEAVVGTFQPMRFPTEEERKRGVKQTRIPDGDPIANYFPAVVDRATFERARRSRMSRRIAAGRKGENFSNLFSGLAVCGNCGAPMHFVNKGEGSKGGTYLVCSNARRAVSNCTARAWRYPASEYSIGSCLTGLNYNDLVPDIESNGAAVIEALENKKLANDSKLKEAFTQRANLVDSLSRLRGQRSLEARLETLEIEIDRLTIANVALTADIGMERDRASHAAHDLGDTQTLIAKLNKAREHHGLYDLRQRLHQMVKSVVRKIEFHPPNSPILPAAERKQANLRGAILIRFHGTDTGRVVFMSEGYKECRAMNFRNGDGAQAGAPK